ncbi:MAG TPA: FAD-dependent monooxygenase [Polyangiales bacterium]|nr:FAD-dependent monooxygenase [Polyangiales bacterium]
MVDLSGTRVGIIGGGIGGLAAGLALSRAGAEIRIFERSTEQRREGIALLVWANAMRALDRLGLLARIRACSAPIENTEVRTPTGDILARLPISEWADAPEHPTVAIRRPDLVAALADTLGRRHVEQGAVLHSFEVVGHRVIARFTSGAEHELDILVGADGIGSTVRAQLLGDMPVRNSSQHAWVGIARGAGKLLAPGTCTATIGHGPRFWCAPLENGDAFWYATRHDAPMDPWSMRALARCYEAWHAPIPNLLEVTSDIDLAYTQVCDRPPCERWGVGPVTLLGDAAHASTPDLGQGACQAIESATVLAAALSRASDIASGLRAYERARMDRTATISRLCWLISLNSTARNPVFCALRDSIVKVGLRSIARGPVTWIMAGHVD